MTLYVCLYSLVVGMGKQEAEPGCDVCPVAQGWHEVKLPSLYVASGQSFSQSNMLPLPCGHLGAGGCSNCQGLDRSGETRKLRTSSWSSPPRRAKPRPGTKMMPQHAASASQRALHAASVVQLPHSTAAAASVSSINVLLGDVPMSPATAAVTQSAPMRQRVYMPAYRVLAATLPFLLAELTSSLGGSL